MSDALTACTDAEYAMRAADDLNYLSAKWHHKLSTEELEALDMVADALVRLASQASDSSS